MLKKKLFCQKDVITSYRIVRTENENLKNDEIRICYRSMSLKSYGSLTRENERVKYWKCS